MLRTDVMENLPVRECLPALAGALDEHGTAVLSAPPGTGKTTLVPLHLAGLTGAADPVRRVLVAEPRRMAARSAARRMAWLLGEDTGRSVGFTVRGERRAGPHTRVEVVTTGVLLQRLQRDQELPGVDVVLLDECHERHLDADTALAFLLDVRAALRPGLRIVAASATQDDDAWARLLATYDATGAAPVVRGTGTVQPVDVRHAPPPRTVRPAHGTRVDPELLRHVAATVRRALAEVPEGDLLCFLPGVGEIGRVTALLDGCGAEVFPLHGRAPASVQETVLSGHGPRGGPRRVILSTAVAESSLTVPGVRVVVDAGLAREPRMDHARGLGSLTTVGVSRAAAAQRLGRAGREAPGVGYRCWAEGEDAGRPQWPSPEIAVADLTAFALQAAAWGEPEASGLALPTPPPRGAMAAAAGTLRAVGAVDAEGRVTERGTRMARMGVHPRLARALLDGAALVGARAATEAVALLGEDPPLEYGDDLAEALRRARRGRDGYAARWRSEVRRLLAAVREAAPRAEDDGSVPEGGPGGAAHAVGLVAALAYPERVARARAEGTWLMAGGTRARATEPSGLRGAEWLAIAVADRPVRSPSARIRRAAVIDEETARRAAAALHTSDEEVRWDTDRRDVVAARTEWLGAIELSSWPLERPDPDRVREAVLAGLRREGTELLRWTSQACALRERLAFLHREVGEPWPDVSEAALLDGAHAWLGQAACRADLARTDAGEVLRALLPWAGGEAARLDELAPERVEVPSGSRVRVDYAPGQPVLAAKLQELFGWRETPRIADGRVPLLVHLLSPAGRPAAVTGDLAGFWREGYQAVRAELRGRYPRHPWPEDPLAAQPTRRTNARRGGARR